MLFISKRRKEIEINTLSILPILWHESQKNEASCDSDQTVMARLEIDGQMLKALLPEGEPRGVDALREQWRIRYCEAKKKGPPVPDRATLYRWLGGKLPRRRESYLRLCGIFDIDPLAALVLPSGKEAAAMQFLYRCFWLGSWRQPALGFLSEFFGHHVAWPPKSIAAEYFKRQWRQEDFEHNPEEKANYYAGIEISCSNKSESSLPQVFHFAYCQPDAYAERWIEYGYIIKRDDQVALVNITGNMQNYQIPEFSRTVMAETWFGQSPVNFRIASLHDFSICVHRDAKQRTPSVRFYA